MAYKPYQKGKNPDIYAKYEKKDQRPDPTVSGVKVFGFRTGAVYKMLLAILYYGFAALYLFSGIYGEIKYLSFEPMDVVLMILKYIFWIVMFFAPLIFLSDFSYRKKLPLFKNHQAGSSLIGLILIWMFCYFMANVNIYTMSQTYKDSLKQYQTQMTQQLQEQAAESESATVSEETR